MSITVYVDPINGLDTNSGLTTSLPKLTVTSAASIPSVTTVLVNEAASGHLVGEAQWTNLSPIIILETPVTLTLSTPSVPWTSGTATASLSHIAKTGSVSQSVGYASTDKWVLGHPNASITFPAELDLSAYQQLSFWLYISSTPETDLSSIYSFRIDTGIDGSELMSIPIPAGINGWRPVTINLGSNFPSNATGISLFQQPPNDAYSGIPELIFDSIIACLPISNPQALTLQSLVSKTNTLGVVESVWGISNILNTQITLDQDAQNNGIARGYSGVSETHNLYRYETVKTSISAFVFPTDSLITVHGGYNSNFSSQTGYTLLDFLNGNTIEKGSLSLNNLGIIRAGFDLVSTMSNLIIANCSIYAGASTSTNVFCNACYGDFYPGNAQNIYSNSNVGVGINGASLTGTVVCNNNSLHGLLTSTPPVSANIITNNNENGVWFISFENTSQGQVNTLLSSVSITSQNNNNCGVFNESGYSLSSASFDCTGNTTDFCPVDYFYVQVTEHIVINDLETSPSFTIDLEQIGIADSLAVKSGVSCTEQIVVLDINSSQRVIPDPELIAIADLFSYNAATFIDHIQVSDIGTVTAHVTGGEYPLPSDSLLAYRSILCTEHVVVNDIFDPDILTPITELITLKDSPAGPTALPKVTEQISLSDSIFVFETLIIGGSLNIQLGVNGSFAGSSTVSVMVDSLVPATSLTDPQNPFQISIINNGETIIGNYSSTLDQDLTGVSAQVLPVGAFITCDVKEYSISLTLGGGTWSTVTDSIYTTLGSPVTIFGLQGVCTFSGLQFTNGKSGYVTKGIFGNRTLNKQLLLMASGTDSLTGLVSTQYLNQPSSQLWSTCSAAARAIAGATGINLSWATIDAPLTDLFPESGSTVLSALQSLAQRVGAVICWNGNQDYFVIDPQNGYGIAPAPPDCSLVQSGGISTMQYLDLASQIAILPIALSYGQSTVTLPGEQTPTSPPIYPLLSVNSAPTTNQPDWTKDVPGDYGQGQIQILVNPNNTGIANLSPSLGSGFVTTNKSQWFPLTLNQFQNDNGQSFLTIPTALIPVGLSDFVMNVGYNRSTTALSNSVAQGQSEYAQKQQLVAQATLERLRKSKIGEATINCNFYGVVPLPGMLYTYYYPGSNGSTVTFPPAVINGGLIESVSISSPASVSITIGQYKDLNLLTPTELIDYSTAGVAP